jgi:hypothetical protein
MTANTGNFFQKALPIAAATVFDNGNLSAIRGKVQNAGNLMGVFSTKAVVPDETVLGEKCVPLRPGIMATCVICRSCPSLGSLLTPMVDPMTWSPTITELVENKLVCLRPYGLKLTYEDLDNAYVSVFSRAY